MKKYLPYILLSLILITVVVLLMFRQQRSFDDRVTLSVKQRSPYACSAAYELTGRVFPKATITTNPEPPREWQVLSSDTTHQLLLIVNSYFNPSESELEDISSFAQKGNTVFISALDMNETARSFFRLKEIASVESAGILPLFTPLPLQLDSNAFEPPLQFNYPGFPYAGVFTGYDSAVAYVLGYGGGRPNLLGIHAHQGNVFLHSAPIAFTNFFTLYQNNHLYLENLLKLASANTRKVVWDEYFLYKRSADKNNEQQHGLLSVILQYNNFRWAFAVTLALFGLYLLTAIKRNQRMIPPYNRPVNESLAFVKTVSKLYFEKADHKNLADKLTVYFLDYVRNRYKLPTHTINSQFAQALATKAMVSADDTHAIVNFIHHIQLHESITGEQLMQYHALLEKFYQKA